MRLPLPLTTVLKHYVVPVKSPVTLQGYFLKKIPESILHTIFRRVGFFPAKPMPNSPNKSAVR